MNDIEIELAIKVAEKYLDEGKVVEKYLDEGIEAAKAKIKSLEDRAMNNKSDTPIIDTPTAEQIMVEHLIFSTRNYHTNHTAKKICEYFNAKHEPQAHEDEIKRLREAHQKIADNAAVLGWVYAAQISNEVLLEVKGE